MSGIITNSTIYFNYFFFNDTATTEIYTLSLHDALPICTFAVAPGRERFLRRNYQQGAEHVEKRDQLKYHGKRQELLKGFLHAGAGEAEVDDDQNEGNRCMHDKRGVGGGISGMNLAEPFRQEVIQAGDKGNAGRGA